MKNKTIEKLIKNCITDAQRATVLNKTLSLLAEIRSELLRNTNERHEEDETHKKKIAQIELRLRKIQQKCPHLETTYYPDASGGNDSETRCDLCGAEI